jgi:hypothetical protein
MNLKLFLVIGGILAWAGCQPKAPIKPSVSPGVPISPVAGVWENNVRGENRGRMIFKENGELTFQNGLDFYNPGQWTWDRLRQELIIRLPQAPDRKLDIFKMYVGDGIQSFDRAQKKITYRFDDQTASLNMAGWIYTKIDPSRPHVEEEPTLR